MAEEELKLLGLWASPYSRRVELILKLKGLKFQYIEESNLREEDNSSKSSLLLRSNPVLKKIPVLFHEGNPVQESMIIVEYIDEIWGCEHPVLPNDPWDRAVARFWARFIDETILPVAWKIYAGKGKEKQDAIEEFHDQLKLLEKELKGNDYFGGEKIGFLDIAAFQLHFFESLQEDDDRFMTPEKFPALFRWLEKFRSNAAVRECLPPADRLLQYSRGRRAGVRESAEKVSESV
ncbi:Glutathione S-transferase U7 [Linum perenne]